MEFIVHSIPGRPFGRAVLMALEEKAALYRFNPVVPGTLRSPEHRARHPFGRVPVIEHSDFKLFEAQAILRYIDRALPTPPLTPADSQAAGRMDQLMNISDRYLYLGVGNIIGFQRIVVPHLLGRAPDEAAIRTAMPQADAVFGELSRQLGDRSFFTGSARSLADILIAPQFDFLAAPPEGESLIAGRSNLADWLIRMNARLSMQATTWEQVSAMAKVDHPRH